VRAGEELDDQEEEFSWRDLREGDEEALEERLLPETGEVEGD
jgi:hypothetical protein